MRAAERICALSIREDALQTLKYVNRTIYATPIRQDVRTRTVTAVGYAEAIEPDGWYLLLRRGDSVWIAPNVPHGWSLRERWTGNPAAIAWITGWPAYLAFHRVGALVWHKPSAINA